MVIYEPEKTTLPALKRLLSYGKAYRGTMGIAIAMLWLAAIAEVSVLAIDQLFY